MIERVTKPNDEVLNALGRLLPQLRPELVATAEGLDKALSDPSTVLLIARSDGGDIVGTLTLTFTRQVGGLRGWIHDVVVDEQARGGGHGKALVEEATRFARAQGARAVRLTTNPSRTAAHRLYEQAGFHEHVTRVYDLDLETPLD